MVFILKGTAVDIINCVQMQEVAVVLCPVFSGFFGLYGRVRSEPSTARRRYPWNSFGRVSIFY